eukprot:XP_008661094.1 probable disease resistance protein At1g12280 [Zea mays]
MSNQRYLVFLENLTSMDDWEAVRELLPDGHNSSCIVVHTTTLNLAKSCVVAHHQELEPQQFSTDRSVRIFYEYCESMDGNNAEMALKTKAAKQWIHRFKFVGRQEDIWSLAGISRMVQSVYGVDGVGKSYIVKHVYYKQGLGRLEDFDDNFMGLLETHPAFGSLRGLFDWVHSYFNSCPDWLKPCIFYLSIFPLDHKIRRRRLVGRWMAEGYSRDTKERTAEDNGEEFIVHLRKLNTNELAAHGTTPHLTIGETWDRDRIVYESTGLGRLRSLTVFGRWKPFFVSDKMSVLRVLDLEDASSDSVRNADLEQMVKLLPRLKFLSLRGCKEITRLPDSLGGLRQLQTLDIRHTSVLALPRSVTSLLSTEATAYSCRH